MAGSQTSYVYEATLAFRAPGLPAVTATGNIGEVPLDKMVRARGGGNQKNSLGAESYDVVVVVEELDSTTGDETYTFEIVSGEVGLGDAVPVGSVTVAGTGEYVVKLAARTIEKLSPSHEVLGLNFTGGGTTPSIKFSAWLALGR